MTRSPSPHYAQKPQIPVCGSLAKHPGQSIQLARGSKKGQRLSSQFSGSGFQPERRCHVIRTSDFRSDLHLSRLVSASCPRVQT